MVGQPSRHHEAEAAEAAGDEVGRVRPDRLNGALAPGRAGTRHHDLADVAGLGHVAEGGGGLGRARRRGAAAASSSPAATGRRASREHRAGSWPGDASATSAQSIDVVRDASGRSRGDLRRRPDAALADLDEPAARRQRAQARGDRVAGERVEHHVDARPPVRAQDLVGERRRAGVHARGARRAHARWARLAGAARGGEDLGARRAGQLHGRQADAAGGGVDEHALARRAGSPTERSAVQAVRNASGIVAASSKVSRAGLGATRSGARGDVRARSCPAATATTASPDAQPVTPAPTATTTPAHSLPSGPGSPG